MTRSRSFTTAAARRRNDPIVWTIDGTDIRLRASVDLAEIAPLVDELQSPAAEGNQVQAAAAKRAALVGTVATFVQEDDRILFTDLAPDLDMGMLVEMVQDLIAEYAGTANPTKPSLSSDGSSPGGESSTDGAQPEASTLPV
jgi:hypothetical protein